jgi:hypothetical protein
VLNRTKEGFDPTQKYYGHYPLCPEFDVRPSWCICDRLEQVMDVARADERTRMKAELWPMIGAAESDVRIAFRAEVEALREPDDAWKSDAYNAAIDDVLALLNEVRP